MKTEDGPEDRPRTACGYVRVSTEDQKDHKISIASQIRSIERWCEANGVELIDMVVEPGLSGRDEGRPQFTTMMDRATSSERPYDMIVVHALSRFARDVAIQAVNYKRLQKAGVQQVSITEAFGKGSAGNLMRSVVSAFNQHYSEETAKHTRRSMRENARDGYFNGGKVPFGYRSVVAAWFGGKAKKKLEIDDAEAGLVRVMFQLATAGDGDGPMGVRAVAKWLNARGHTLRGSKFHNSNVADILSRTHLVGFYMDGKKDDHGDLLPESEWIRVPCPAIVDIALFEAAAALRATRQPKVTPPRVVNGVTLLPSKIARCAEPGCNAGLTVRSGKGGRYHYYTCEHRVNRDRDACGLRPMPRKLLDGVVLDALMQRVLEPEHLRGLLAGLLDRSEEAEKQRRQKLAVARTARTESQKAIGNLLKLVETGALSPTDSDIVERIASHRQRERALAVEIEGLERQLHISKRRITDGMIEEFGRTLAAALRDGDANFRRRYVSLLVDRVEVSNDTIRLCGSRHAIEHALIAGSSDLDGQVPIFDRNGAPETTKAGTQIIGKFPWLARGEATDDLAQHSQFRGLALHLDAIAVEVRTDIGIDPCSCGGIGIRLRPIAFPRPCDRTAEQR